MSRSITFAAAILVVLASGVALAQVPATNPATQPALRTPMAIMQDLNVAGRELSAVLDSPQVLMDPVKRKEIAPKAIAPLKRVVALFDEMGRVDPRAKAQVSEPRIRFVALLSLLDDADAQAALAAGQQSADAHEALTYKATALLVRWWKSGGDAANQGLILDELAALAKANAQDDVLAPITAMMSQQAPANPQIKTRVESIITEILTGETAKQIAEQIRGERKQKEMENKPLVLSGVQLNGQTFTTAQWMGKVVLVDFWATWSRSSVTDLARLKKTYTEFHAKGLEIIGVSCDQKAEDLTAFLAKDGADMPWPQLFDKDKPGWHPLAKDNGVNGIPTFFLIDRKGVLRSVDAHQKMEELVAKLMAE